MIYAVCSLRQRFYKRCAVVVCALSLSACSLPQRTVNTDHAVLMVNLPVGMTAPRDQRNVARLLEYELENSRPALADSSINTLLHLSDYDSKQEDNKAKSIATAATKQFSGTSVLIVPGLFGKCVDRQSVPFGNGNVRTPRELTYEQAYHQYINAYSDIRIRAIDLPDIPSLQSDAALIAREIDVEAAKSEVKRIVIVGYSKGLTDSLEAILLLENTHQLPAKLKAVVSIAGMVMGTPLADWYFVNLSCNNQQPSQTGLRKLGNA